MSRITFISRMTVKPGRERDFVDACNELTASVKQNEPGVIYYEFFKLRETRRYAMIEYFPIEETKHAHMKSTWLAADGTRIVDCLDGTWEREYLDAFEP